MTESAHKCPERLRTARDPDGPVQPIRVTCGGCGRAWCERCDPCPSALCPWCHGRGHSTAPLADAPPAERYAHVTQDTFHAALETIVGGMSAAELLAVPGVYEVLSEELNNEVLQTFDGEGGDE